jgi:hypothetical protein
VYWAAEADTVTAKKPKLRQMKLEKKKLIGLAYLTDELAEDGPAPSRSSSTRSRRSSASRSPTPCSAARASASRSAS